MSKLEFRSQGKVPLCSSTDPMVGIGGGEGCKEAQVLQPNFRKQTLPSQRPWAAWLVHLWLQVWLVVHTRQEIKLMSSQSFDKKVLQPPITPFIYSQILHWWVWDGIIFGSGEWWRVCTWEHSENFWKITSWYSAQGHPIKELVLVERYLQTFSDRLTTKFVVHKLNLEGKSYTTCQHIYGCTIFLGGPSSAVVFSPNQFLQCMKDAIYFTDVEYVRSTSYLCEDLGIYDLIGNNITRYYTRDAFRPLKAATPTWFTPNPW
jgi:Protein of unknown function (DUF295)